jgi:hypothetical protein
MCFLAARTSASNSRSHALRTRSQLSLSLRFLSHRTDVMKPDVPAHGARRDHGPVAAPGGISRSPPLTLTGNRASASTEAKQHRRTVRLPCSVRGATAVAGRHRFKCGRPSRTRSWHCRGERPVGRRDSPGRSRPRACAATEALPHFGVGHLVDTRPAPRVKEGPWRGGPDARRQAQIGARPTSADQHSMASKPETAADQPFVGDNCRIALEISQRVGGSPIFDRRAAARGSAEQRRSPGLLE